MSIGTALTEARHSAGLSVGQVSEKTRIRETIIKGIEHDDYRACGGDFYARGHIRAIARVVGTDPAPLIEEYDETLRAPQDITAAEAFRPAMPLWMREQEDDPEPASHRGDLVTEDEPGRNRQAGPQQREPLRKRGPGAEQREPPRKRGQPGSQAPSGDREPGWRRGPLRRRAADEEPGPGAGASLVTEAALPGVAAEADALGAGAAPAVVPEADAPDPGAAPAVVPEADTQPQPVVTAPIAAAPPVAEPHVSVTEARPDSQPVGELMPAGNIPLFAAASEPRPAAGRPRLNRTYVLALALLAAVGVLGYLLIGGSGPATKGTQAASSGASHPRGHTRPGPAPTATHTTHGPALTPAQPLSPVSATALGPAGHPGDDPASARLAISGGGAWHTDWYATPNFGNLQGGTGLLLDMGRSVTITGAQMTLGNSTGASLQLRAGNTPAMTGLAPVAGASNAGGALQLSLSKPVTCRYVLIWFTKLPPDDSGTFQVSVSDVKLTGAV